MHFQTFPILKGDVKTLREELAKRKCTRVKVVDSYKWIGKETKISPLD
jgi:hypothetical protein